MSTRSRMARPAVVLGLVAGLVVGTGAPAFAAGPKPPDPASPSVQEVDKLLLPAQQATPAGNTLETDRKTRPVAPGTTLTSWDRLDDKGWLRADQLSVDLGAKGLSAGYLSPGKISQVDPLSKQADRTGAIAGVNGDFFDINNTGAPNGAAVNDGKLLKSQTPAWSTNTAGVSADGLGQIAQVLLDGELTLPGNRKVPLDQFNAHFIKTNGIGAFTSLWGTGSRGRSLAQGAQRMTEVLVTNNKVVSVTDKPGAGDIAADSFVLVGRETGGDLLRALKPGDDVAMTYGLRSSGKAPAFAIGGNDTLIKDGQIPSLTDPAEHPRTAVGFSADGRRMLLMTVDGRQVDSRGVTLAEMAALMKEAGAYNAVNLDGGGSSTLLAREPGQAKGQIENQPSDGAERPTPNGIGLYAKGSGKLKGFWVEPVADPTQAPGVGPTRGGRPDRVFPGLTRKLAAHGHDEAENPAPGTPHWIATGKEGSVDQHGLFRGRVAGGITVSAVNGRARGQAALTVLNPLTRVGVTVDRVTIPGKTSTGTFGVVGFDREGFTAPIEPADLKLTYDTGLLKITPADDGTLTATPLKDVGSTLVTVEVKGQKATVPISVGLDTRTIADFDDGAQWKFGSARGSGKVEPVTGGRTGAGLRLSYDFTQSTATRTAYAYPPQPIEIAGQPQALGAWVYGHDKGEWTAFTITDANGQSYSLYGPYIQWEGWKYLEMPVPQSVAFPIKVNRFYTIETGASRQYTGEVLIDDFVAKVPPSVQTPPATSSPADPLVIRDGTANGHTWRFAVMSDAQFIASDPDSVYVQRARRTLREALKAKPDFLVINGDFVDTGYDADFALAKKILDEELGGKLPYYYVPGNHEIYGPGNISNFRKVFGEPSRTFDHKGTRFVLRDSSLGSLRAGGFDQILDLRKQLDSAATDRSIKNVVVFAHHPIDDPSPTQNSQLGDRKEAAMIVQWLADFRASTGKGAAYMAGHAGTFAATRTDGVLLPLTGNSGKSPAAAPDAGGFTGWALVGIDPHVTAAPAGERNWSAPERSWFQVELRPHVDSLELAAPTSLRRGQSALATATVVQEDRRIPVSFPVSADWWGSTLLYIGPAKTAPFWAVASYDPATGQLTALHPGTAQLGVTVNGVSKSATLRVDW